MRNWAGNIEFRASAVHRPESVADLQRLVADSTRLRPLGTMHSFNRIADSSGALVTVAGLPRRIEIDEQRRQVTMSAGLRYGDITPVLHAHGLALANLGSLPHVSVAGAVATGTHGSGERNPSLAGAVAAIELVTADGELRRIDRSDPEFAGHVVSLGALGVVAAMTLDLVPAFDIRQYVLDDLPFEALLDNLDAVLGSARSVSVFTTWRSPVGMQVWRKQDAAEPPPPDGWLGARPAEGPRHPVPGMPPEHCTEQLGKAGPWHHRLAHFRLDHTPSSGAELQTEYFVARADAAPALEALAAVGDEIADVLQICELRTVAADGLWLSPAHDRDSATLHFTWSPDEASVAPVVALVEERLAPFSPRPHWGKVFSLPGADVVSRYPRAGDFAALRLRLDPGEKFTNHFVADLFG